MNSCHAYSVSLEAKRNPIQKNWWVLLFGKNYNDYIKYVVLLCIVASLTACQGVPLTKDKVASIHSVCINSEIQKPKKMDCYFQQRRRTYSSSSSSLLITAIAEGLDQASREFALRRTYAMSGTSIDSILKEQFENELKKSNIFNSVVSSEGDAEFKFQIMNYGFNQNYLDRKMRPKLLIKASLVTSNEIILWNQPVFCCAAENSVHSHSLSELCGHPDLMRQSLTEAVKASCIRLIEDMQRDLERK
ncbi:MAG: hypothetical protein SWH54_05030 [Thermodesulfobacteriota bacterium]|nr:hypothetical protein [Thermodesulfobacteriota bacterium]